jgi:hypothetical protein
VNQAAADGARRTRRRAACLRDAHTVNQAQGQGLDEPWSLLWETDKRVHRSRVDEGRQAWHPNRDGTGRATRLLPRHRVRQERDD